MHEANSDLGLLGRKRNGRRCGACANQAVGLVPAEGEDHMLVGHDLEELAQRRTGAGDQRFGEAVGTWVERDFGPSGATLELAVGQ